MKKALFLSLSLLTFVNTFTPTDAQITPKAIAYLVGGITTGALAITAGVLSVKKSVRPVNSQLERDVQYLAWNKEAKTIAGVLALSGYCLKAAYDIYKI